MSMSFVAKCPQLEIAPIAAVSADPPVVLLLVLFVVRFVVWMMGGGGMTEYSVHMSLPFCAGGGGDDDDDDVNAAAVVVVELRISLIRHSVAYMYVAHSTASDGGIADSRVSP